MHAPLGQRQAQDREQDQDGCNPGAPPAPEPGQQEGEQDVILFLDGQAPGVQQGLEFGIGPEILRLLPEQDVRQEGGDRDQALAEIDEIPGHEQDPCDGKAEQRHQEERRQDAAGAAFVKADQAVAPGRDVAHQDRGDQEAADHEKDVDPHEAAAEGLEAGMEEDDRHHGERSQPVDLGAVCDRGARRQGQSTPASPSTVSSRSRKAVPESACSSRSRAVLATCARRASSSR